MEAFVGIVLAVFIFVVVLGFVWVSIDMASALIRRAVSNLLKIFETGCV
jgi:hypothetical protein